MLQIKATKFAISKKRDTEKLSRQYDEILNRCQMNNRNFQNQPALHTLPEIVKIGLHFTSYILILENF